MKTEESLYIKVLIWTYNNSVNGFTEQNLLDQFKIDVGSNEYKQYLKFFRNGSDFNGNPPLIDDFNNKDGISYWCLTDRGMSAAIDYLDLKEARENSRQAMYIAIGSLIIATAVGIAQIIVQICFN